MTCLNGGMDISTAPSYTATVFPPKSYLTASGCTFVSASASRRAGDDARARDPGLARSDSPMDAQFRRRVCTPPAETHRSLWRYVAPRRGVLQSQWRAGVSLARRGSGWGDPRRLGSDAAKCQGSKALLPKAAKGIAIRPQSDRDRQAFELRGSTQRGHAYGRTPNRWTTEQSSRELASTYSGARATNAALQVDPARQARPLSAWTVSNHFRPCRHRLQACHYREIMHRRFEDRRSITGAFPGIATPLQ